MEEMIKLGSKKRRRKKKENILPELVRFEEFTDLTKQLALEGARNDSQAKAHKKNADIMPDTPENERHIYFVLEDLVKKIIRFRNQRREEDLVRLAFWTYLLWMKLYPKPRKGGGSL